MTPGPGVFRTKLPKGFLASGINCGVRRYRPDLGVIISEKPSVAAGVFTQNTCKAAPVLHSEKLLPADNIKAVITNSGQANAATGEQGVVDNQKMVTQLATNLGCAPQQILTASTGVIGEPLAINKITQAIPTLVASISDISEKFALAILTTDLVPKTVYKKIQLSQGEIHITGICKGSGMIHPNMATMLGYLLTDAVLTPAQTQTLLTEVTNQSFNMISVDGETSTNDSVFMLANGASEVGVAHDEDLQKLKAALTEIAILLAKSIARDGEGASKLIEVQVKGAPDTEVARQVARSLTISPLLKTAIYGESANWGRIIARVGAEKIAPAVLAKCQIFFQDAKVYPQAENNLATKLKTKLQQDKVTVTVDLSSGKCSATAWGCDLTEHYVKINAEYVT